MGTLCFHSTWGGQPAHQVPFCPPRPCIPHCRSVACASPCVSVCVCPSVDGREVQYNGRGQSVNALCEGIYYDALDLIMSDDTTA